MKYWPIIFLSVFLSCNSRNPPPERSNVVPAVSVERIGIQAFGTFEKALVDTIEHTIRNAFDFQIKILPDKPLPESAFVNLKTPRYRADSLLKILRRSLPDSMLYIIGITSEDISTTKRDANFNIKKPESKYTDWGVIGLGYQPGPACIVSTFRIQTADRVLFMDRLKKICVHEIGHNLGLEHCKHSKSCIMRDAAESIKTMDLIGLNFCEKCKGQIYY